MKVMTVCTGWMSHCQYITDHQKADTAYKLLKEAMTSHDRFSNDKDKAVTIDTGDGTATYKIETLTMVSLDDCSAGENTIIEREVWTQTIKAKVAARLAPAA
jgi:hypothetical protein